MIASILIFTYPLYLPAVLLYGVSVSPLIVMSQSSPPMITFLGSFYYVCLRVYEQS
jgi:hypothetical protein